MKSFPLKLIAISISIIYVLSISAVSALNPEDASVTTTWLSQYYQGDISSVRIIFQNNIADELEITRIGIHLDWMPPNDFYSYDLSANPASILGFGNYTFELTNIPFLAGASPGSHSYFVSVDYIQNNFTDFWDSPSFTIQIHDGSKKIFNELLPQIVAKMTKATYESTEAQSLLQQATTEYEQAIALANDEKWQEAVTSLQNAFDYLDQAEAAEQNAGQNTGQSLLLYIAITVIAVVIALSIIAVIAIIVSRKRKKTDSIESIE